jgi:hypothetical protein
MSYENWHIAKNHDLRNTVIAIFLLFLVATVVYTLISEGHKASAKSEFAQIIGVSEEDIAIETKADGKEYQRYYLVVKTNGRVREGYGYCGTVFLDRTCRLEGDWWKTITPTALPTKAY